MTLDVESGGDDALTYTRMRAPYVNPDGFRFEIYRRTMFSRLGVALGMQDITIGDPGFDDDFVIKSTSEDRVRELLAHERIRGLMRIQPQLHMGVSEGGTTFKKFPDRVDELHFRAPVVIKDTERLVHLFELFQEVLPRLTADGRLGDDEVARHIRRLRGPGGSIVDGGLVRWSGNEALYEAAEALGELGDPRAVGALVSAMNRGDLALTARAVVALGRIGNKVRSLVPLLGDDASFQGRPLRVVVSEALEGMGEGTLARAFGAALEGRPDALRESIGSYRPQVLQGLLMALTGSSGHHAARALVRLDAVEVLPEMRAILRTGRTRRTRAEALAAAVQELETRSALPRPADAPISAGDTLPRPTGSPDVTLEGLPRASGGPAEDT